jgi:hypothetical protein
MRTAQIHGLGGHGASQVDYPEVAQEETDDILILCARAPASTSMTLTMLMRRRQ